MYTRKRPGSAMWLVMRAPFLPIGSFAIWTRISWPSFSRSVMSGMFCCSLRRNRRPPPPLRRPPRCGRRSYPGRGARCVYPAVPAGARTSARASVIPAPPGLDRAPPRLPLLRRPLLLPLHQPLRKKLHRQKTAQRLRWQSPPRQRFPAQAACVRRLRGSLPPVPRRTHPPRVLRHSETGPILPPRSLLLPEFPRRRRGGLAPNARKQQPACRLRPCHRRLLRFLRLLLPWLLRRTLPPHSSRAGVSARGPNRKRLARQSFREVVLTIPRRSQAAAEQTPRKAVHLRRKSPRSAVRADLMSEPLLVHSHSHLHSAARVWSAPGADIWIWTLPAE